MFCYCLGADVQALEFVTPMYTAAIPETGQDRDGTVYPRPAVGFLTVRCIDNEVPLVNLNYGIQESEFSMPGPFRVNASTGELRTIEDLDYETRTSYTFMVICTISPAGTTTQATANVEIAIQPVNEFRPTVTLKASGPYPGILLINETQLNVGDLLVSTNLGQALIHISASDNDAGEDGVLAFTLGGSKQALFSISTSAGNVTIAQQPDADIPNTAGFQVITFSIEACDPSDECFTSNTIQIYILAANDNFPRFAQHDFAVSFAEDDINTVGMIVANASCTDGDIGPGELDRIEFINPSPQVTQHFVIADAKKGIVFLNHTLDYEQIQAIGFTLKCVDNVGNNDTATVEVTVQPRNDHHPMFDQVSYNFSVSRTTPALFHVGTTPATDKDRDVGGNLQFSIQVNPYFSINNLGMIRLINSIQNATQTFSLLTVTVSDGMFSESTVVRLLFTDGNFVRPKFTTETPIVSVSELTPIGFELFVVQCNDSETGLNGLISYSIISGNTGNALEINADTGAVLVANPLILGENQTNAQYFVTFRCSDHGVPVYSDLSSGLVIVFQDNTSPPNIENDKIVAFVNENAPFGSTVVTIIATDNETDEFRFTLHNLTDPGAFQVEPTSGNVIVTSILDREMVSSYSMVIVATEVLPEGTVAPVKSDGANLIIYIRDVNDNPPICDIFVTSVDIEPGLEVGSTIIDLNCSDADTGQNANISYSLEDDFDVLDINTNGILLLSDPLEQANRTALNLRIFVADMGVPVLSTEINILVRIRSENDHLPTFTNLPTSLQISESASLFSFAFRVIADDPDKGEFGIVRFRLENESMLPFTLTPNTGELFVTSKLNFHSQNQYTLNISAFDPQFTIYSTLTVFVLDANEFSPQCDSIIINKQIPEAIAPNVASPIPLSCSDGDIGSFGNLSYAIISGNTNNAFSVDPSGVVRVTNTLDYEITEQYTLIVRVSDGGSPPRTQSVTINIAVGPSNEFTPVVANNSYTLSIVEGISIGSTILQTMASDEDNGVDGELTFSLDPIQSVFGINSQGDVQVTGTVDREKQSNYSFTIRVADGGSPPRIVEVPVTIDVIDIDDSKPSFTEPLYTASLTPSQAIVGEAVVTVECTDPDEGANSNFIYQLPVSEHSSHFSISPLGVITISQALPLSGTYSFPVQCLGELNEAFNDTAQVSATIQINSNITFSAPNGTYTVMLSESSSPIHPFLDINATSITGTTLTYNLINSPSIFSIGDDSGIISLIGQLDYEMVKSYTLVVKVSDGGSPPNSGQAVVYVLVLNANDEVPRFTTDPKERTLVEGQTYTTVAQYQCTDGDDGEFGEVTYSIGTGNTNNAFFVDPVSGTVQLNTGTVDYETAQSFSLQLICKDGGDPAHMDSIILPIFVTPVNEHPPVFSASSTTVSISESLITPSVVITNIQATDQDAAPHNQIWYAIIQGNQLQKFDISHTTGHITLIQPLDFESVKEFTLTLEADDSGGIAMPNFPVLNSSTEVIILVTDANDHTPVFNRSTYSGVIDECASIGDLVDNLEIVCTDGDSGSNAATILSIASGNTANAFSILTNGRLRVKSTLDFESLSSYILTIRCADQGNPVRSNDVTAIINIRDCGEFGPVFDQTNYQFSVSENSLPGAEVGQVLAVDQDGGETGKVTYSFNNNTIIPFGIHPDTGVISITQPLDYETQAKSYFISVSATDSANQTDSEVIVINLINIDDNVPKFTQSNYFGQIRENSAPGTTVSLTNQISCSDADDAADGIGVTYSLTSDPTDDPFPLLVQSSTGVLTALGAIDAETKSRFIFTLVCNDSNGNIAMATGTVDILPFNDFAPKFINTPYTVTLAENPLIGSTLIDVEATDNDVINYNTITYGIVSGNAATLFSIEPSTGQITVQQVVDYEQFTQITLRVSASNIIPAGDTSGSPQLTGYADVVINVTDKNDNNPSLSPISLIVVITDVDTPGTVVTHYTCTDADSGLNGETSIYLNGSNADKFTLLSNGTLVTAAQILSDLILQIECTDKGDPPNTVSTILTVSSASSNDHSPSFPVSFGLFAVLENHTVGAEIGCIVATDADGPQTDDGIIDYSLQLVAGSSTSDRFDVNEITGCLFVSLALDYDEESRYDYNLIASDRGVPPRKTAIQVIINIVNVIKDPPEFVGGPYMRNMSEGVEVNTVVTTEPRCTDRDDEDILSYSIASGNNNDHFSINNATGVIVLSNSLDFETSTEHTLVIRCTDSSGLFDEENVYVTVFPVNEFTPILTQINVTFTEQSLVGTPVTDLKISDGDAGPDGQISITINSNNTNLFTVTPTGTLLVNAVLDREETMSHNVSFQLTDGSPNPINRRSSTNWIVVELTDINDNVPQPIFNSAGLFKFGPVNATVPNGYLVGTVNCSDADINENAALTFSVEDNEFFSMSSSGIFTVSGDLRNRDLDNIAVTATCSDGGTPQLQASFTIVVEVFELNLHQPMFQNNMYSVSLPEDFSTFSSFLNVTATDNDTGLNGRLQYQLVDNFDNLFFVAADTGSLQIILQLDFEKESMYNLVVEAVDAAIDSKVRFTASTNVTVEVTGVNEHTPVCSQPIYTAIISKDTVGQVLTINCTDLDQGMDGDLVYNISTSTHSNNFVISNLGTISILSKIPADANTEIYEITVVVADQGSPSRQTEVTVRFIYSFENVQTPQFAMSQYATSISESTPVGNVVLTVTASDSDPGLQGEVSYELNGTSFFRINSETGGVFVSENLNAEAMQQITFEVIASDSDPKAPLSNSTTVTITLTDVNDNVPYCTSQLYIESIGSSATVGTTILTLQNFCMDDDVTFSQLTYSLAENNSFSIAPSTGELTVAGALIPGSTAALSVTIADNGSPALSTTVTVSVQVRFDNTQPPIFSAPAYHFNVSEGTALLQSVGYLNATDADSPASDLKYSFVSAGVDNVFYIDPSSGEIKLTSSLDFETITQYNFMVKVQDAGGFNDTSLLSSTAQVTVNVLNVNDHLPVLSNGGIYGATVNKTTPTNTVVVNIVCTDGDSPPYSNPTIASHDFTSSVPFSLTGTGGNWAVQVSQDLTGISGSMSYAQNITCADQGGQSVTGQVFLFVPDINAPAFSKTMYTWSVPENTELGAEFSEIQASSVSGTITYSISDGNENSLFYINPNSGIVSLAGTLDYEAQTQHALVIRAVDDMNRLSSVLLLVQVLDVNDEVPLVSPSATFQLEQSREVGYPIGQLVCTDSDTLPNATQFNFSFVTPTDLFSIDSNGVIRLEGSLDATPVYVLPSNCYDVSQPDIVSIGVVTIQILFVNQYTPQFGFTSYETSISEAAALQTVVIMVDATDGDVGSFGDLDYSITVGNPNKFFIDPQLGQISVLTSLDREEEDVYSLTVEAVDGGPSANDSTRKTGTTTITINVLDTNDNNPMLDQAFYVQTILTNHSILTGVFQANCSDPDLGENGSIDYISPPHPDFIVDSEGLVLLSSQQSDQTVHNFYITCHDMGAVSLSSSSLVTIVVNKLNSAAPVFDMPAYNVSIPEDLSLLSTVVRVNATTTDAFVGIEYSIVSGNTGAKFSINSVTGEIILSDTLSYMQQSQYTLTVRARTTGFVSNSAQVTVSITLFDVNNNAPVFSSPFYAGNVTEAVSTMSPVVQLSCSDEDPTDTLTYSITSGLTASYSSAFVISSEGLIIPQQPLDYEDQAVFTLLVQCSDGASTPAIATVRIDVLPVNEFKPAFSMASYQFSVKENTAIGTLLGSVNATDTDAGSQGDLTYLLLDPGNLSPVFIDPSSGDILISSFLDYEQKNFYNLSVIARDQGGLESYVPVEITVLNVNDVSPLLSPSVTVADRLLSNSPNNFFVQSYTCTDPDGGSTTVIISSGNDLGYFVLNNFNQLVWTGTSPNITSDVVVSLILLCTDAGNQTDTANIAIAVGPPNKIVPVFSQAEYSVEIAENVTNGTEILQVSATTNNSGAIQYSFLQTFAEFPFAINSMTGSITVNGPLSRETVSSFSFPVLAMDTTEQTSALVTVNIVLIDVNDNHPVIAPSQFSITLLEDSSTGIAYAQYICSDADAGMNGQVSFSILSGSPLGLFSASADTGHIILQQSLDFESAKSYNITVACSDNGSPSLTSTANLLVSVLGVNEFPPVFDQISYNFTIPESLPLASKFGQVTASDDDDGVNGMFHFEVLGGPGEEFFLVDSSNGNLRVKQLLNATENSELVFVVGAIDNGPPAPFTSSVVTSVSIDDVNSPPKFDQVSYIVIVPTSTVVNESILTLMCFDTDLTQNAHVSMMVASNDLNGSISLQTPSMGSQKSVEGSLNIDRSLNAGSYELIIQCMDDGTPSLNISTSVTIIVQGSNAAPVFNESLYARSLNENTPTGTSLLTVLATDDADAGVTYSITGGTGAGTFVVEPNTGVVTLNLGLNFEVTANYLFTVSATDKDSLNPLTGTTQVTIIVQNVNDIAPTIEPLSTIVTISEEESAGFIVQTYTCSDGDGTPVTLSIIPPSAPFTINAAGEVRTTAMLDYEDSTSHILTVTCTDATVSAGDVQLSSTATLSVAVQPFNFQPPQFTSPSSFSVTENTTVGTTIGTITSVDPDNRGSISYSTNSHTGIFNLNPTTGVITLLSTLDRETTDEYTLVITASDGDNIPGGVPVTPKTNTTTITVSVGDINDNIPICALTVVSINIFEGQYNDSLSLFNASCKDADIGLNGEVRYQLVEYTVPAGGNFALNNMTGELTFSGTISIASSTGILQIQAQDLGTDPMTNPVIIQVIITVRSAGTPFFDPDNFNVTISENHPPLTLVFNGSQLISALHNTKGRTPLFSLSILSSDFIVDTSTGNILLNSPLDFDSGPQMYPLAIRADVADVGVETIVTVYLTDYNDNPPQFSAQIYNVSVTENQPNGTFVADVSSMDADSGINAMVTYSISGSGSTNFDIDSVSGRITSLIEFDRETINHYSFIVAGVDHGAPPLTSTALISVSISDVNDSPPRFTLSVYPANVNNIETVGKTLITFSVEDPDLIGSHRFELDTNDMFVESILRVDPVTGALILKAPITGDYEPQYTFNVRVDDELHIDTATVILTIFEVTTAEFSIVENTLKSFNLFDFIQLSSFDITEEATYSILAGDPFNQFNVTDDGILENNIPLDRENISMYTLQVGVVDNSTSVNVNIMVAIIVQDQNDNTPVFGQARYQFIISEQNYDTRTIIGQVNATDRDDPVTSNGRIRYTIFPPGISPQLRRINPVVNLMTGEVSIIGLVDREAYSQYSFGVRASDFGEPPRSSFSEVELLVADVNDRAPVFEPIDVAGYRIYFTDGAVPGSVAEKIEAYFFTGQSIEVTQISFSDIDVNDNVTASISTNQFVLTNTTSPVSIATNIPLTIRRNNETTFFINITDAAGHHAHKMITVIILEAPPATSISTTSATFTPIIIRPSTPPTRGPIFPETPLGIVVIAVGGFLLLAVSFFFCCVLCYSYQFYRRKKESKEK